VYQTFGLNGRIFICIDISSGNLDTFSRILRLASPRSINYTTDSTYFFYRLPILILKKDRGSMLYIKVEIDQFWWLAARVSGKSLNFALAISYAFDYIIIYLYVDNTAHIYLRNAEQERKTELTKRQKRKSNFNDIVAIIYRFLWGFKIGRNLVMCGK